MVDVGSDTNVAVGVLHRRKLSTEGGPVRGLVHHAVTEIYYVLEGSGTLVTGGSLEEPRAFPADSAVVRELVGPSSGGSSRGATSRRISQGDVVIIPAGVFHAFSEIESEIRYLSLRVDPEQVLPAGYLHPALRD
ncbi:MAG TPA: cupin domain-containing protein [Thermoanaerobaculia bacterium]|nr:cupin domain-containing protein [Thermoanaerobaculia bacterium]